MTRRGQAALEFLTTYGWAFLVILVMIGALAYFGVLSPKALLPDRCLLSAEFECVEKIIDGSPAANDFVNLRIRNNVGATVDVFINLTYMGGTQPLDQCNAISGGVPPFLGPVNGQGVNDLAPGRIAEFQCVFAGTNLPIGDKQKFEISLLYRKDDGQYWSTVKGEIFGEVRG